MGEMEKLREKQRRRRQKRTVRILILSPLIALVFVAGLSFLTQIETVVVRNFSHYDTTQICSTLPFSVGDSLFSVDRDKLADQIAVSNPYVKRATVEYSFPDRVEISLTPATVCFALRYQEIQVEDSSSSPAPPSAEPKPSVLLLDEDFKVLEAVDAVPNHVLFVDGMDIMSYETGRILSAEDNIQVSIVHDLIEKLKERDLYQYVSRIDLNKKYRITVQIHDVITVNFGNSENFAQKVNALVHILSENDVTVPAEISVRNYSEGRYSRLPDPVTDPSSEDASASSSTNSDRDAGETKDYGTPSDVEN